MPLIPRYQWARRHCRRCDRLQVAESRAPLARCRWLRPLHLKAFCFCEKLTLLHLVPIDEAPASGSMLRAVCVCSCRSSGAGVQIDTFEVGEVFGHLAADRVLEGSHVRLVQRLCVRCAVPLLGVTSARVHVRVNRVDHVQESVLKSSGTRSFARRMLQASDLPWTRA